MSFSKRLAKWLAVGSGFMALSATGAGCLARPVGQQPPTTKVNFTSTVSQQAVDKVDLLFVIDNSASMGDKQTILAEAVPDLISGLLTPKCVDPNTGNAVGTDVADPNGNQNNRYGCPGTSEPEFKPVSDMHIGIVSSSLGNFGAGANDPLDAVCDSSNARANDRAHLLNIAKEGGQVDEAKPANFLAWFPTNEENNDERRHPKPANATTDLAKLQTAFQSMVEGTGQTGCGLEAQLESMYHFLVQPDPWTKISLDAANQADLGQEVDVDLLQQRADFLRPDSLVAIIMLTDEDDSSADPLAVGGQGWAFMARKFPGSQVVRPGTNQGTTAPRGTTECDSNPGGKDANGNDLCTSCGFQTRCNQNDANCQRIRNDANCKEVADGVNGSGDGIAGYWGPTKDSLNVRFHRMKQRYGIDPQYPIRRYVDGLTKARVPNRTTEHTSRARPDGSREISGYQFATTCTNPLFARTLPRNPGDELCNLTASTRSPDFIFFAVVGGVPNNLLHFKANDPEASRIVDSDWVKILGQNPEQFNYAGIDPHMVQSIAPRQGLDGPSSTRGDNGSDDVHGREWDTGDEDLQYACTFELPVPRTCTNSDTSCDCADANRNPPLCGAQLNQQVRAKAYPTIREFQVVRALGDQGVVASLCPIQLTDKNAPTYGYRPAVAAIVDRLKNALTTQCLPQKLRADDAAPDSKVDCLILAQLAEPGDRCENYNLKAPAEQILKTFREQQREQSGAVVDGGVDLAALPVCEVPQVTRARGTTCTKDENNIAWCYVERVSKRCPQEINFSESSKQLVGARFSLQCINQFTVSDKDPAQQ